MITLTHILKEVLTELADTNKVFSYHKTNDRLEKDDDEYTHGVISYSFKTDSELEYEINISYLSPDDEAYESTEYDGQVVDIQFSVSGDPQDPYRSTDNIKELFPIMNTITKCIKKTYEEFPFKYIIYLPTNNKAKGKDVKGGSQRMKLYDYYIKKEFPHSHTEKKGKAVFTKLK